MPERRLQRCREAYLVEYLEHVDRKILKVMEGTKEAKRATLTIRLPEIAEPDDDHLWGV